MLKSTDTVRVRLRLLRQLNKSCWGCDKLPKITPDVTLNPFITKQDLESTPSNTQLAILMTSLLYGAFLVCSLRTGVMRRGVGYVKMLMATVTLHVLLFFLEVQVSRRSPVNSDNSCRRH